MVTNTPAASAPGPLEFEAHRAWPNPVMGAHLGNAQKQFDEAQREWQRHAWRTVDNCLFRYRIVAEDGAGRRDAA